ncbi:MAG: putative porin, partial [Dysgonamonadaceae bacterium]|nr:putative porin [Dysgonamonadaceae bacterium]
MRQIIFISVCCICCFGRLSGQESQEIPEIPDVLPVDSVADPLSFPLDSLSSPADSLTLAVSRMDSLRAVWKETFTYVDTSPFRDSLPVYYWRISENLGEFRPGQPDTLVTGFFNRNYADGWGTSIAYLGNLGTPAISRIFQERETTSLFMFADAYSIYNRRPGNFDFINTRVPYSKLEYQSEGDGDTQNERLRGGISVNLNKKLNLGFDLDFLYARGRYNHQGAKHIDLVFYSSYFSDRYRYHFFYNNRSYINDENGGITDDRYITSPEAIGENQTQNMRSKDIPTRIHDTWNRVKGSRFFYTHRYNFGFEKETGQVDEEGEDITQFVTVGSIIHTADIHTQQHKFISKDAGLDTIYARAPYLNAAPHLNMSSNDTTRMWNFKNTLGVSLREGFNRWAKFDLTAYASFDYRQYLLMERFPTAWVATQTATFVGGEMAKTTGKILRYRAQAEFGVLGENLGDVDASGMIETRIPVFRDTASLTAKAYLKNTTPSFYEQHYHSKYFWWDRDFNQTQRVYVGGELNVPHTKSMFSFGVENVTNYVYFDEAALPRQHSDN